MLQPGCQTNSFTAFKFVIQICEKWTVALFSAAAVWVVAETDRSSSATRRLTVQCNTVSQRSSDMLFCSEQPSNADSLSAGADYTNSPKLSYTRQTSSDFDTLNRISYAHIT